MYVRAGQSESRETKRERTSASRETKKKKKNRRQRRERCIWEGNEEASNRKKQGKKEGTDSHWQSLGRRRRVWATLRVHGGLFCREEGRDRNTQGFCFSPFLISSFSFLSLETVLADTALLSLLLRGALCGRPFFSYIPVPKTCGLSKTEVKE